MCVRVRERGERECACVYVCVCRTSSSVGLLDRIGGLNRVLVFRTSRKELEGGKEDTDERTQAVKGSREEWVTVNWDD